MKAPLTEQGLPRAAGFSILDSVRRDPTTTGQMAPVSILNATLYSVTADSDGDGRLDAPQVVSLPADASLPPEIFLSQPSITPGVPETANLQFDFRKALDPVVLTVPVILGVAEK